jgi:hypothetical protein
MTAEQSRFIVDTANTPGLDISGELFRVYTFPGGETLRVDEPNLLWVKVSSDPLLAGKQSHRIALRNGNGVYVRAGWLAIEWHNRPGQPAVAS